DDDLPRLAQQIDRGGADARPGSGDDVGTRHEVLLGEWCPSLPRPRTPIPGRRSRPAGAPRTTKARGATAPGLRRRHLTVGSEVPVLVLGVDGLADDVARAGAREEVVVLVGVRAERGEDRRV